jgi:hypothetical protein
MKNFGDIKIHGAPIKKTSQRILKGQHTSSTKQKDLQQCILNAFK